MNPQIILACALCIVVGIIIGRCTAPRITRRTYATTQDMTPEQRAEFDKVWQKADETFKQAEKAFSTFRK